MENDIIEEYERRWDALEDELQRAYPQEHYVRVEGEMCIATKQALSLRAIEAMIQRRIIGSNFTMN